MPAKNLTGSQAPDFTLPTQTGEPFHLADLIGKKPIVLFFYPKDNSPGCTAEACAFRDSYEAFQQAGAEVIGISSDSEASHQSFMTAHRLPFTLLSDAKGEVQKLYNVGKTIGLFPGRVTLVIDKTGTIRHTFNSQFNPQAHIKEALNVLQTLQE